jgi:phosphatidylserine/phosphatidylglycerophosphate/cardiolipin synthase-like enzyme
MSNLYPPVSGTPSPIPAHRIAGESRCEFYLGQNAGTELLQDLQRARRSIVIVSPFLTAGLLERLSERQAAGVHITLATTTDPGRGVSRALVEQIRHTDERAMERRINGMRAATAIMAVMVAAALWFATQQQWQALGAALLILVAAGFGYKRAEAMRVFSYSYRYPYSAVRVFESPFGNGHPAQHPRRMFVHSKAYVIDEQVAYLGSLNFTSSGMTHNFESCVRFTEPAAVQRILAMVDSLCTSEWWETRDAAAWGRELYPEPAN